MNLRVITLGLVSTSLFLASCGSGEKPVDNKPTTEVSTTPETPVVEEVVATAVSYMVSVNDSKVEWKGTKKIGGGHNGEIKLSKGTVEVTGGKISGGEFEVDMASMTCLDIEDAEMNGKLIGHLKAPDFFAVDSFPTASVVIKSVEGETLTADLTIRGITNEVAFPATVTEDENGVTGEATLVFDRTKYKSQYGSESFFPDLGDKIINNEIELKISVKGTK